MPEFTKLPKIFISYAWEEDTKIWVHELATRLRSNGVEAILDQWDVAPGDSLPEFMENSVSASDFVLIVCTPAYKRKSDSSDPSGVGYEKGVITGELFVKRNQRKFIPVLRKGKWLESAPAWVLGKNYIDLAGRPYSEEGFQELLRTIYGKRKPPPPLGPPPDFSNSRSESGEKGTGESAKGHVTQIARIKEAFSATLHTIRFSLPKAKPFLKFAGFSGIAIVVFWAGFQIIPPLMPLFPAPNATATLTIDSPVPPTRTLKPNKTATPVPTQKVPVLPTATSASTSNDSIKIASVDGAKMVFVPSSNGIASFWIDQMAVTASMFEKFVQNTGYVTDAEKNGVGFVWTFLGEMPATQFPGQTGVVYEWKLKGGVNWKNPSTTAYTGNEVLQVSWNDATAYCQWAGRELLTLKEWEVARQSSLPLTFYSQPDGLGEWGEDKTSGMYRVVLGRQEIKWGGYTTYVFQEQGFIEYRSADRLTFRCKDR